MIKILSLVSEYLLNGVAANVETKQALPSFCYQSIHSMVACELK